MDAGRSYARVYSVPFGNLRGSLRGQRPPSLSSNSTVFTLPRRCAVVHASFISSSRDSVMSTCSYQSLSDYK